VVFTIINVLGVEKTARTATLLVLAVIATLTLPVISAFGVEGASIRSAFPDADTPGARDILQGAALLFFAFAGYARIATLGEEVVDPARTIPRAIPVALGITVLVYAAVIGAALVALGPGGLAAAEAPLADVVDAGRLAGMTPLIRAGAAVASLGVLLSLLAGVSRTAFAMARERDLPGWLDAVHPRRSVPHRAELLTGAIVAVLAATLDVRDAIGFSAFAVLAYYALANASAWTLTPEERRWPRWVALLGLVGCAAVATSLPVTTLAAGGALFGIGAVAYGARRVSGRR
jgi:APA family basic amino acid/polyamine antiporter